MKYSICWNITSKCNYHCKFCNRIEYYNEIKLDECFFIVDKLKELGIKKITLTGGEIFLYKNLQSLIDYIYNKDIIVSILTNGLLITRKFLIDNNNKIFQIGLPIDTTSSVIQERMGRIENHLNNTLNIINIIRNEKLKYNIKINTVVTMYNYDDIKNINNIICEYKINKWNLFLYNSIRNVAKKNSGLFSIDKEKFEELRTTIIAPNTDVSFSDQTSYENEHIIISPHGDVIITRDSKDIIIGKADNNNTYKELKKYGVFI